MTSPIQKISQLLLLLLMVPSAFAYGPAQGETLLPAVSNACTGTAQLTASQRTGLDLHALGAVDSAIAPTVQLAANAEAEREVASDATPITEQNIEYHILSKLPDDHRLQLQFHRLCLSPLVVATHPGPYHIRIDPGWAWVSPDERLALEIGDFSERQPDEAVLTPEVASQSRITFSRKGYAASQFDYAGEAFSWSTRLLDFYFAISSKNVKPRGYPADFLNLIVITVEDKLGKKMFQSALFIDNYFDGAPIPFPKIPIGTMKRSLLLQAAGFPKRPGPNQPVFATDDPERNCRKREGLMVSFGLMPR